MKKICTLLALLAIFTSTRIFAMDTTDDELAIKGLINELCQMWTTESGESVFTKIADDNYMLYGSKQIFTKYESTSIIGTIIKTNKPQKVSHSVNKIIINGSIAFEYGIQETTNKDNTISKIQILNIFAKKDTGWKLMANLPPDELSNIFGNSN